MANAGAMLSALLMFRRVAAAFRYAVREEDSLNVFGAAVLLAVMGTSTFALGEDWNPVDAFHLAVSTLTTTGVADPDLVLDHGSMKVSAGLHQLVGIGVLIEIVRRLGLAFVEGRQAS